MQGQPVPYPSTQHERGRSAAGIIIPILSVFLGVSLVGGGGVFLTYMLMKDDEEQTAEGDPSWSTNLPNPNTPNSFQPRTSSAKQIETIDDALASLVSYSTRNDALRWLASHPVDRNRQAEVARALSVRLLADRFRENEVLDALSVWATRDSLPALRIAIEERRGDMNKILQLFAKLPDQESAGLIAKQLESSSTASDAVAALQAIGPPAKTAVVQFLGSSNRTADLHARQLLQEWGVDVQIALIDRYVEDLKSVDRSARTRAAQALTDVEVIESRKDQVARALNAMLLMSDDAGKVEALKAVQSWGNKDTLSAIIDVAQKGGSSSSSAAMDMLAEMQDPLAAAALCELLADYSKQQRAKACLTKMGKEVVEAEVVKYYNHPNSGARQQARLLLHSFDTSDALILEQCIADLGTAELERHKGAVEWLATADVVEARRNEVADQLAKLLGSSEFGLRDNVPLAFSRWATVKHADKLYALLESRDSKVRIAALKILVVAGDDKIVAPQLDKLLHATSTRNETIAVLDEAGPAVEDLMILLLGSGNTDVLSLTCDYMFHHGTEKSVQPLSQFRTAAVRAKAQDLVEAARRASTEILARARKQSDPDEAN